MNTIAATVTITISGWIIPTIATLVILIIMFRPLRGSGGWLGDFDAVLRLFWLIPLLFIWLIYFIIN